MTITEEDLAEAVNLPQINDFVFTNLYAFKMCRNESRLTQAIKKLFHHPDPEAPGYSEDKAMKYKTVDLR